MPPIGKEAPGVAHDPGRAIALPPVAVVEEAVGRLGEQIQ
jgi:hypothetical protein